MAKKVLVTGATGHIATYAIPRLLEEGVEIRAFVHDASKADTIRKMGAEILEGSFTEEEKLHNAVKGVNVVLSITPAGQQAFENASAITRAAKNNQVEQLIRISAIKAAPDAPTDNGRLHFKTDSEIIQSGIPYTILRPNFYMQNLFASVPTIKEEGKLYYAIGDGRISMIDVWDVADCCVRIILDGGHLNKIYDPNGPQAISFYDIADLLTERLGKKVTYIPISVEQVGENLRAMGADEWACRVMMDYARAYSQGWGEVINNDVEMITGRPPRSFATFYDETMRNAFY